MAAITAGELAGSLKLNLRGDPRTPLEGAATLEEAGPRHLSFIAAPKYFPAGDRSEAGCLIAPPAWRGPDGRAVLESETPRAHFAAALAILFPPDELQPGIHPSAVIETDAHIDPSAEIGPGAVIRAGAFVGARTRIGAGSFIGRGARVGADCLLYARVTVYDRVSLGAGCVVHAGAVVGADGFGFEMADGAYRKVPQVGTVEIGADVEIGANTCIDRATLGATIIGDGTKLDNLVHIAHNCRIGRHVVIAAQTGLAGGVTIGDFAVIGGQVGIGDKARIEARAVVGSGAGILTSKIVRAGEPVWGTPARPLKQYLNQLAALARLGKRGGGV
jgi:UDP-3-O-[3-hydroxymyristoyl] glucosamine N-acyltransferase